MSTNIKSNQVFLDHGAGKAFVKVAVVPDLSDEELRFELSGATISGYKPRGTKPLFTCTYHGQSNEAGYAMLTGGRYNGKSFSISAKKGDDHYNCYFNIREPAKTVGNQAPSF